MLCFWVASAVSFGRVGWGGARGGAGVRAAECVSLPRGLIFFRWRNSWLILSARRGSWTCSKRKRRKGRSCWGILLRWSGLLLTTYSLVLTPYYLLRTTYLLLTTHYSLLTIYYLLLTTYYLLLTTSLIQGRRPTLSFVGSEASGEGSRAPAGEELEEFKDDKEQKRRRQLKAASHQLQKELAKEIEK